MEIQDARAAVPRRLPTAPVVVPGPDEMLAEVRRRAAAERRARLLDGCPEELTAFAAGASALVYHPFVAARSHLDRAGASHVAGFDAHGSQALAFTRNGTHWVVFRGSESSPPAEAAIDWGHDLLCLPWGWPPRHLGFARAWRPIRRPVLEWIAARGPTGRVVVCGHSLGGALALAAAHDVAIGRVAGIEAVITFGAPRLGTWPWTARFHGLTAQPATDQAPARTLREVTWRVHNEGDIVTHVPPLLFVHCGRPVPATPLTSGEANPFRMTPAPAERGPLARLRGAYRSTMSFWPYSPLNILVDLALFLFETAPQHFMRHYAPAFPDRPFQELGDPPAAGARSRLDHVLRAAQVLLVVALAAGLGWAGWLAYRASPEITGGVLVLTLVYAVLGYETPAGLPPPALPSFLRPPKK